MSENKVGSDELERYQHFPPFRTHSSIAERAVVCGRGASARPPGCNSLRVRQTCPGTCFKERGSPSPQETRPRRLPYEAPGRTARSVAANALGLGPRERRCKSCRADHFQLLSRITVVRPPVNEVRVLRLPPLSHRGRSSSRRAPRSHRGGSGCDSSRFHHFVAL